MRHEKIIKLFNYQSLKFLLISLVSTLFFLILIDFLNPKQIQQSINAPINWQKLELTVQGIFMAKAGDYVTLQLSNGKIIIPKVLLMHLEKKDDAWMEQSAAKWKAEIATPNLSKQQWTELYSLKAESIYLAPYTLEATKPILAQKGKIYEMSY